MDQNNLNVSIADIVRKLTGTNYFQVADWGWNNVLKLTRALFMISLKASDIIFVKCWKIQKFRNLSIILIYS
jgi:hypothetical protein